MSGAASEPGLSNFGEILSYQKNNQNFTNDLCDFVAHSLKDYFLWVLFEGNATS